MFTQCKEKVTKSVYDNMIKEPDVFPTKTHQKLKPELDIALSKKYFSQYFIKYNFK